ncbi:MAG: hypothetical protein C0594_03630 [Marinilabiliales bacterium]|nr:MAG: hypothetical protein C0594_03630 [Marinilabiliales bacterium]
MDLKEGLSRTRDYLEVESECKSDSNSNQNRDKILFQPSLNDHSFTIELVKNKGFNVLTGRNGTGKASLVEKDLLPEIEKIINGRKSSKIEGINPSEIKRIISIDSKPIGKTPRSNPATYTKLSDQIRNLFASLDESKADNISRSHFSFNTKGGRCENCEGAGRIQIGMHFLGKVDVLCPVCNGKRFRKEILKYKYKGKNISEVYDLSVEEALGFFNSEKKISGFLQILYDLGLGYICLGQSSTTLSGGEAQRVKLAAELAKAKLSGNLYIMQFPSSGLHPSDISRLIDALNKLAESNMMILIENNHQIIAAASNIIEFSKPGNNSIDISYQGIPELYSIPEYDNEQKAKTENFTKIDEVLFKGVKTNNLKGVDFSFPNEGITVILGPSGSGKSSLAFETVFSESQSRFNEGFSVFVKNKIPKAGSADFSFCRGITPSVSVSQELMKAGKRSDLSTLTGINELLRLLYSRVGEYRCPDCGNVLDTKICKCGYERNFEINMSMFSFNHELGACKHCDGLGEVILCDPDKLVTNPELSLLDGALKGTKTGLFYGDVYGQYVATLKEFGKSHNINYSVPYCQLSEEAKNLAMNGSEDVLSVQWKYKRGNREGVHSMETNWKGFLHFVNEEYQRKHGDKRGQAMMNVMSVRVCPSCNGARLNSSALSFFIKDKNIADIHRMTITEAVQWVKNMLEGNSGLNRKVFKEISTPLLMKLKNLQQLGLAYLQLSRRADTLSGGEAQRVKLSSLLGSEFTGVTYVLD